MHVLINQWIVKLFFFLSYSVEVNTVQKLSEVTRKNGVVANFYGAFVYVATDRLVFRRISGSESTTGPNNLAI